MTLRSLSLRGAAFLAAREALGISVRLVGVLLLTRMIGPERYGIYAGAVVIVALLSGLSQLGTEVYLITHPREPTRELYDQVFSFLVVSTTAAAFLGLALAPLLSAVTGDARFTSALLVLLVSIPVNVLWAPAQAMIERAFNYKQMAALEVGGDICLYVTSVALAAAGAGVWAPVAGYIVWQCWLLVGSYRVARYMPKWNWSPTVARELIRSGTSFNLATYLGTAVQLINPLIVGRYAGATGVGYVALAIRLIDTLTFTVRATWRLSIVSMSRVQGDIARLRRGLEEGMGLLVLATGPVLVLFGLSADRLIPFVFGQQWAPTADLYPLLALAALVHAMFLMESSLLLTRRRNIDAAKAMFVRLTVFALVAVPVIPRYGIIGYPVAEVSSLAYCVTLDRQSRKILSFSYRRALPWIVAFSPPLLIPLLLGPTRWMLLVTVPAVLGLRSVRHDLCQYWILLRSASDKTDPAE
jgi:O-antigen/teichoic acid export membrane protein